MKDRGTDAPLATSKEALHTVALIVDNGPLSYRAAEVVRMVLAASRIELGWVGLAQSTPSGPVSARFVRQLDSWLRPSSMGENAQCASMASVPWFTEPSWVQVLLEGAAASEAPARPNLLIYMSSRNDLLKQIRHARIPVWWFSRDSPYTNSTLEGFAPVARRQEVSCATLWQDSSDSAGPALLGVAEVRTHPVSPELNRQALLKVSLRPFAEALLSLDKESRFSKSIAQPQGIPEDSPPLRVRDSVAVLSGAVTTAIKSRREGATDEVQWVVGIGAGDLDWEMGSFDSMRWLETDRTSFSADPFPIVWRDQTYLFVETYRYEQGRGVISVFNPDEPEGWMRAEPVLAQPFHLSFPNVFRHEGEHYMLPEQAESGQLVLYRSHAFPGDWRPFETLLDGVCAADPVLFEHGGYWWLMFSCAEFGSPDNNLQLYYAAQFPGPFKQHPQSPVKQSLFGSRMAGRVFTDNGRLIRPAQDGRRYYGGSLVFAEIDSLNPDAFSETVVRQVESIPSVAGFMGMHTYNRCATLTAVDGFRNRPRA